MEICFFRTILIMLTLFYTMNFPEICCDPRDNPYKFACRLGLLVLLHPLYILLLILCRAAFHCRFPAQYQKKNIYICQSRAYIRNLHACMYASIYYPVRLGGHNDRRCTGRCSSPQLFSHRSRIRHHEASTHAQTVT